MEDVRISPVTQSDVPEYRAFLLRNDFASGKDGIFQWYRSLDRTSMFAAFLEGRIIGTGMSFSTGNTGWIGSICVDEDYRGNGLGRRLTEYSIHVLKEQGLDSILLRGSEQGGRLYRSMGFVQTGMYENFMVEARQLEDDGQRGLKAEPIDALNAAHLSMDRKYSGEDRSYALSRLPRASGIQVTDEFGLAGFAYPTIGDGFLAVGNDEGVILQLLKSMMSRGNYKIRTLKGTASNRLLRELGYESGDGAIRMALGSDPLKKIENVAGTISSSIG